MTKRLPFALAALMMAAAGLTLAGCTTMGGDGSMADAAPAQLTPLPSSTVQSQSLPPLGSDQAGQSAQTNTGGQQMPANDNQAVLSGSAGGSATGAAGGQDTGGQGNGTQVATADSGNGSFVTLNDVGSVPNSSGRDLSAPLTAQKLIGGWTVESGSAQCRLYLSLTAKVNSDRYTARAPGCSMQGLSSVTSWKLAGSQVQLFNSNGDIIAAMLLSGGRFVGTLVGGQSISMVG